ncbi:unnamed protein product [Caenorhabditis sp. 36 PRJEB53466]|nr:unnamed protein product [Caenorhabditis sp. 36 PRJEB53466]
MKLILVFVALVAFAAARQYETDYPEYPKSYDYVAEYNSQHPYYKLGRKIQYKPRRNSWESDSDESSDSWDADSSSGSDSSDNDWLFRNFQSAYGDTAPDTYGSAAAPAGSR